MEECRSRKKIINTIERVFQNWGYEEIATPTVEYYDNFNDKTKSLKEEEIYKFFDNRGHILVLRPDMTVPVARMIASKLKDINPPIKLYYSANIFRVHEMLAGVNNEYIDCGVELLGADENSSDLEIIVTAIESMKAISRDNFKIEIGNVNILKTAMDQMNLSKNQKEEIANLIEKKSLISLGEKLNELSILKEEKEFLNSLPWLFGEKEVFEKAKKIMSNKDVLSSITYLENIYKELSALGYEKYISIDMSMVPRLDYYTGIIFRGYKNEICRNVLRGGRYDGLCKSFGRDMPAVGFSIGIDLLINSIENDDKEGSEKISVKKEGKLQALKKAIEITNKGRKINMIYSFQEDAK